MDRGAWWATVHGVAKSQTRLSDFTYRVKDILIQTTLQVLESQGSLPKQAKPSSKAYGLSSFWLNTGPISTLLGPGSGKAGAICVCAYRPDMRAGV